MATLEERMRKAKELIYATKSEVPPPRPRNVEEYRLKAIEVFKKKLPKIYDVFCDVKTDRLPAPETGTAWTWMKEYINSIMIRTRLLRGIREPKAETSFLGWKLNLPIMPAPMGDTICAIHPTKCFQIHI